MAISLQLANQRYAYFDGNTHSYKDMIRAIAGAQWDKPAVKRKWNLPLESVGDALRIFPTLAISSEVKEAYQQLQKRNDKAVAIKDKDLSKAKTKLKGLKGELYPYQGLGVEFLDTLETGQGAILAFDMGLGKSLTSIASVSEWIRKGIIDHVLVVCPSPLKYSTWEAEIQKWTDMECIVIDGDKTETVEWDDGTKERLTGRELRAVQYQQYQFGVQFTVMNYELFLHDYDKGDKPSIIPPVNERWAVILDEAHRIKNPKAKTTKNLIKVLSKAGRKILGTGTPLENNIQELWSLVDFCRPGLLGNYFKFIDRYVEVDYFGSPIAPKPELMPELKERIAPIMLRKTKEEALPHLPKLDTHEYWVEMTKEQSKVYKMVKEGIIQNLKTQEYSYLEVLAQITRMQQILDSPALLREVLGDESLPFMSGKLQELPNIIEDLNPAENKFILFSQYKEMTDLLVNFLTKSEKGKPIIERDKLGYIKGGMKPTETQRVQKGFQEGDLQCIVMTTAGNYGLNLFKGSYVICFDQLFNPQKMNQIYSRVHRNGVMQGVTAINLVTRNSYEEKKLAKLASKRELFKAVVDEDDLAFAKLFTVDDLVDML